MQLKKIISFIIIAVTALPLSMKAQITTGSLSGVVKDDDGKSLPGATVTALFNPSNIRYATSSSRTGSYNISNMRPGGPYTITVSYVGHDAQTYNDVYIQLAEATVLDPKLTKTNAQLQTVTVVTNARNTIINANRTGATTNISRADIQRLPTVTRSLNDLTRFTPQATSTSNGSVGGGNYRQNNITVDGADFNNNFGIGTNLPAGGSPISLDAIEQLTVSITPFDVRQSGFIGSSLNAVTRSGTNQFSGSAYEYFRTSKEQGDRVGSAKVIKTPFNFQQYGFRLCGPIIKNKLFFFGSYEYENRPTVLQTRVASTPGNPYSPANTGVSRPTEDSLNYIRNYLKTTYGYDPGEFQNYALNNGNKKILGRLDWNINSRHRFNIRYNQVEGGSPNPPSTSRSPLAAFAQTRTSQNAQWFRNSNYFQGANFYSLAAELNSRFGTRFTNMLRGTYTYQNDSRTSESADFPFVDILSSTGTSTTAPTPYTSFGYEPFTKGNLRKVKAYSFIDNFTMNWGRNLITAGAQVDFSQTTNGFQRFATSYYTFDTWNDFATGQKPSSFGITYSLSPGFAQAFPKFKFAQYSAYIQDEINISDRFKLTGGVRADLPTYPDVAEIKTHPLIAALTFAHGVQINTGVLPKKRIMWSPRVGFNWDVNGDRSFQVRGGAGIFTGKIPFVWIVSQSGDAGLLQVTQAYVGTANTPGPFNPNPAAYLPSTVPAAGTVFPTAGISAISPDFRFPQSLKASLAFDKRIAKGWIFTMEGIVNKDIYTAFYSNPNLVDPTPLNVAGYADNRMIYPNPNNLKFVNPLNSAGIPTANGTTAFNTYVLGNGKKGYYASLTTKLEKSFSKGLTVSAAYVASVAANLFDGSGDQPSSAWQGTATVNGSNFAVLSNSGFVVPNRFIAAVSYRREYFKHAGTTISLAYEGSAAGRYSYTYTADFNRDGNNNDLMYIPKDPSEITFVTKTIGTTTYTAQQQSDLFFAFVDQDKYLRRHKGEYAERNAAKYPFRSQLDAKLLQDIFVNVGKKRNTVQFSLDIINFTNLLNHKWGAFKTLTTLSNSNAALLVPTNVSSLVAGGTIKPTFQLASDVGGGLPTQTFRNLQTTTSTYYMEFGVRYIFN